MKTENGSQLHLGKNITFMIKLLENNIPIVQFILDFSVNIERVQWILSKVKFELHINGLQLTCNLTE